MPMFSPKTPNLSWLFILLCIGHFPTFGMYVVDDAKLDNTYDLGPERGECLNILETQPQIKSQTLHEQEKIIFNASMEFKTQNESIENLKKQNCELQKSIFNAKIDLKTKNESVEFLTKENEILNTFVDKQRRELGRQRKTEKEMQSKLIQKKKRNL
jgi:hypothetical protein